MPGPAPRLGFSFSANTEVITKVHPQAATSRCQGLHLLELSEKKAAFTCHTSREGRVCKRHYQCEGCLWNLESSRGRPFLLSTSAASVVASQPRPRLLSCSLSSLRGVVRSGRGVAGCTFPQRPLEKELKGVHLSRSSATAATLPIILQLPLVVRHSEAHPTEF